MLKIFDKLAEFGIPLRITEFDVDINDVQTQADFTRVYLTAVFSHPATETFMMWGFWESNQWRPAGCMIRADWSINKIIINGWI